MATSNVQVILEIGHTAIYRPDKSDPGLGGTTHDWVVFLRGPKDGPNISMFIRKVVFHLHHSFQNPHRVVEKPPYEIRESGYAGFMLPIDVHFKPRTEEVPYRIRFDYDLTLLTEESCNCLQTEKITFRNPSFEFRRKLLDGGGTGLLETDIEAIRPDRHLVQTFEHRAGAKNRDPGSLTGPLSFQEFAQLFGLTCSSATAKRLSPLQKSASKVPRKPSSDSDASSKSDDKLRSVLAKKKVTTSTTEAVVDQTKRRDGSSSSSIKKEDVTSSNQVLEQSSTPLSGSGSCRTSLSPPGVDVYSRTTITTPKHKRPSQIVEQQQQQPSTTQASSTATNPTVGSGSPHEQSPGLAARKRTISPVPTNRSPSMSPSSSKSDRSRAAAKKESRGPAPASSGKSKSPNRDAKNDRAPPSRRGSLGFVLPSVEKSTTGSSGQFPMDRFPDKIVSEPSDSESDDDQDDMNRSYTSESNVYLDDVRVLDQNPISPLDPSSSEEEEEGEELPEEFAGTPPRVLTADEELERCKLQALLSQLEDRTEIQSVVDLLAPLGAYVINRPAGTFSFNLYMLDDATIERIKELSHFDECVFEEEEG